MENTHVGIIRFWKDKAGYGIVSVGLTDQYFLHITGIVSAPQGVTDPTGCSVSFDVAEPYKNGKLKRAINATIEPLVTPSATNGGAR
jgi:hypothetical protein